MKKFEPHYRLVRVGMATKKERASRQQRMFIWVLMVKGCEASGLTMKYRQATQEPWQGGPWYCQEGCWCQGQGQEEVDNSSTPKIISPHQYLLRHGLCVHLATEARCGSWWWLQFVGGMTVAGLVGVWRKGQGASRGAAPKRQLQRSFTDAACVGSVALLHRLILHDHLDQAFDSKN
jgi:hypothetical protein